MLTPMTMVSVEIFSTAFTPLTRSWMLLLSLPNGLLNRPKKNPEAGAVGGVDGAGGALLRGDRGSIMGGMGWWRREVGRGTILGASDSSKVEDEEEAEECRWEAEEGLLVAVTNVVSQESVTVVHGSGHQSLVEEDVVIVVPNPPKDEEEEAAEEEQSSSHQGHVWAAGAEEVEV